ncbi:unnamed protein product [Caenorhabditis auriculariae]|uniref:Protein kinase domain-containing protein n=1 Tax=Caenorhabditis auriculariae TaxID=2777116 RepID=A0A8S1HVS2_9PELO|nr:unnamed protein product [Caenorhabditis auriculariae]
MEGDKRSTARKETSGRVIQIAKNIIHKVSDGMFRLKGGSETLPTTPCEPTSPNLANGNIKNSKQEAPPGYEIEGSEAAHSGVLPKTEDKVLSEIKSTEGKGSGGIREGQLMTAEERKKMVAMRDTDDLHHIIVPLREERNFQIDDETFLEKSLFFMATYRKRKPELSFEGQAIFLTKENDFTVLSVGVLLKYTRDERDDLDDTYESREPVRIQDYIVSRSKVGVSIDGQIARLWRSLPRKKINAIGIAELKVAVKALLKDAPNSSQLSEKMLEEARIMLSLHHDHVIEIYGWAIDKKPFMILMEMMDGGSLDSFLINNFDGSNDTRLLKFALEAAKGIAYLHEMDVLHRDVAARNCLLTADLTLKVADFGLATSGSYFYMKNAEKLPTRYLSPETLSIFRIWPSNLIYEIFSGGMMPYEEYKSADARDKTVDFIKGLYKDHRKAEGEPKTVTADTEASHGNEEGELNKKDVSTKLRRRKPVSRAEIMEDICPTQEETAAND